MTNHDSVEIHQLNLKPFRQPLPRDESGWSLDIISSLAGISFDGKIFLWLG